MIFILFLDSCYKQINVSLEMNKKLPSVIRKWKEDATFMKIPIPIL